METRSYASLFCGKTLRETGGGGGANQEMGMEKEVTRLYEEVKRVSKRSEYSDLNSRFD